MASLILLIFSLYSITLAQPVTVSIESYTGFTLEHNCVQGCLASPVQATEQDVGVAIQCDSPYVNGCFCASSAAATASSFLTSCVNSRCSQGDLPADVTSAVSIYNYYCLAAGYTLPGVTTVTSRATSGSTTSISVTPSKTQQGATSTSTTTTLASSETSSSSSSSGPLSPGAIAGITIVGFLVSVFGLYFAWRQNVFTKKNREDSKRAARMMRSEPDMEDWRAERIRREIGEKNDARIRQEKGLYVKSGSSSFWFSK